jgi:predicted CXXCH cytochrome family protein
MDPRKTTLTLAVLTVLFLGLAVVFFRTPARPERIFQAALVPSDALAIVPDTIRISAGRLVSSGGDASGLQCYACHDKKSPPKIVYDANHHVVLPKEHRDLIYSMRNCAECHPANDPVKLEYDADNNVILPKAHLRLGEMAHGSVLRNEDCYTCHDPNQLDQLHTAEGTRLTLDNATLLCAGCHGTTYRDWQAGAHGRRSGYWDQSRGELLRQGCTSCHDPHAPVFTPLIPMPGPHALHARN